MASILLREAHTGSGASRLSYDMPASPYISGFAEQAQHIQALQERVAELEEALKRERHRADLCQEQLEQCIAAAVATAAAAAAAGTPAGASTPAASAAAAGTPAGASTPAASAAAAAAAAAAASANARSLGSGSSGGVASPRYNSGDGGGGSGSAAMAAACSGSAATAAAAALGGSWRAHASSPAGYGGCDGRPCTRGAPSSPLRYVGCGAAGVTADATPSDGPGVAAALYAGTALWVGSPSPSRPRSFAEGSDEASRQLLLQSQLLTEGCSTAARAGRDGASSNGISGSEDVRPLNGPVNGEAADCIWRSFGAAPGPESSDAVASSIDSQLRGGVEGDERSGGATAGGPLSRYGSTPCAACGCVAAGGGGSCGKTAAAKTLQDASATGAAGGLMPCTAAGEAHEIDVSELDGCEGALDAQGYMNGVLYVDGGMGAVDGEYVTITKREYELLLLKDKAMNVLQEGITIADCSLPDMPLIYANAGFVRTTGYSTEYVIGKNCRFLQGEGTDSHPVVELKEAISQGRACVVQLLNYKKNGDPFVNYLSLTPIHDATTGRLTHYVGVQSDITELVNHKKAELAAKHAALQAAVATEAKSQFLARMSHEIRTPLNGMIAVGQLLAETSLTPAQWDLVNTIRCSGETLLTLITDILDFSRIEANKMVLHNAVFKLDTVIEAAMEIAGLKAAQRRLQVAYHIGDHVPRMLYGDAPRLQQILLNILNNAIKFTEEGELLLEVWPEGIFAPHATASAFAAAAAPAAAAKAAAPGDNSATSPSPATTGTTAAATGIDGAVLGLDHGAHASMGPLQAAGAGPGAPAGGNAAAGAAAAGGPESEWPLLVLHFSVRDTGIGIAPADLGRLFNSFTQVDASPTRRYGGSGLGLAISRKLCEAMGGHMWAESKGLTRGSTFSWTITCRLPQQAASKRRVRRASLVCVSRPPTTAGMSGAAAAGGSGPGSSVGVAGGGTGTAPAMAAAAAMHALVSPLAGGGSGALVAGMAVGGLRGRGAGGAAANAPGTSTAGSLLPYLIEPLEDDYEAGSVQGSESSTDASATGAFAAGARGRGTESMPSGASTSHGANAVSAAVPGLSFGASGGTAAGPGPGPIYRNVSAAPALPYLGGTPSPGGSYAGSSCGGREGPQRHSATGSVPPVAVGAGSGSSSTGLHESFPYGSMMYGGGANASIAAALAGGGDPTASLPLLRGKKVLLVEPCVMVRQVLMLALRSWGCRVCAVASSQDAVRRLVACGTLAEAAAPPPRPEPPRRPCMTLRHAGAAPLDASLYDTPGPYDCVILDMKATTLLRALTRADDREAQRLVFMGWPGQNEPEDEEDEHAPREVEGAQRGGEGVATTTSAAQPQHEAAAAPTGALVEGILSPPPPAPRRSQPGGLPVQDDMSPQPPLPQQPFDFTEPLPADVTARPPRAVTEEMSKPQNRQLGYVTVTRPVRQGRLKLALEEVLMMQLDGGSGGHPHQGYWSDDGEEDPLGAVRQPYGGGGGPSRSSVDVLGRHDDMPGPFPTSAVAVAAWASHSHHPATIGAASGGGTGSMHAGAALGSGSRPWGTSSCNVGASYLSGAFPSTSPHISTVGAAGPAAPSFGASPCRPQSPSSHAPPHPPVGQPHHQQSSLSSSLKPALVKKSGSNAELPDFHDLGGAVAAALAGGRGALGSVAGDAAAAAAAAGGKVRILLAEDNAINMKVALGILKRTLPYADIATAENGVQALDAVAARGGIDGFDLVLMDLHMPVMGGMEAMAEIEQRYTSRRCRVVAVTADAFEDTRDSCLAAGFDGWLTKPFRVEDLVRVVGRHLGAVRAASAASAAAATASAAAAPAAATAVAPVTAGGHPPQQPSS